METKFNQYYITMYFKDSPIYTILFPFINFKQACNSAQRIVNKSSFNFSFTVHKPKFSINK